MKKLVFAASCSFLTIAMFSCNKNATLPVGSSSTVTSQANTKPTTTILAKYKGTGKYDNSDHSACPPGDGNCLDLVVIKPHKLGLVISGSNNGTLGADLTNDQDLYDALTVNQDELTITYIDGIRDGIYKTAILDDATIAAGHVILLIGESDVSATNYAVSLNLQKE